MTLARRLCAATLAVVLALFPVAMERCRTACVSGASEARQAGPATHACHEAAADGYHGARIDPMARACGHNDEARTYESASLAAGTTRTVVLMPGVSPVPQHVRAASVSLRADGSPDRSRLLRLPLPLNSPLRL